jgi:hypothetical protein
MESTIIIALFSAVFGSGTTGAVVYRALINRLDDRYAHTSDLTSVSCRLDALRAEHDQRLRLKGDRLLRLEESSKHDLEMIRRTVIEPLEKIASSQSSTTVLQARLAGTVETLASAVTRLEQRLDRLSEHS